MRVGIYIIDTTRRKLPWKQLLLIPVFGGLAALMLWFANETEGFTKIFDILFICNIVGFYLITTYDEPWIDVSKSFYEGLGLHSGAIKLDILKAYLIGKWQWIRFGVGILLLIPLNFVAFDLQFAGLLRRSLFYLLPDQAATMISSMVPTLFLALFVGITESWIWVKRLGAWISLTLIEKIDKSYVLHRRAIVAEHRSK